MEICNEQLITAVQAHECLYDKRSPLYKNRAAKEASWEAIAGAINASAYNCKTRWRSLCDRNRREIAEEGGRSGSANTFRKPWKLRSLMTFVGDAGDVGSPATNVNENELPVAETSPIPREPQKKKVDDLFEDALLKMREKYSEEGHSTEDDMFFSLLKCKLSRLSPLQKDELQADILLLVSNKMKHFNL